MTKTSRAASQTQVLDDVRRALGHSNTIKPVPLEPYVEPPSEEDAATLVERFIEEAVSLGCKVYRVDHAGAVGPCVAGICTKAGVDKVVVSGAALLAKLGLSTQLEKHQLATSRVAEFRETDKEHLVTHLAARMVGVTAVDAAIAETGSLLLTSDEDQALLVSLLPPIHIAVLKVSQIRQSLTTVIEKLNSERMGHDGRCRSATLISGPSRTSDVELTLSIGVHGPKELHVIILAG